MKIQLAHHLKAEELFLVQEHPFPEVKLPGYEG